MLRYDQDGSIVTLTLDLPERRNPISEAPMIEAIVAALARLNADLTVRAAILTGAGSAFSSGGDLRKMAEPGGPTQAPPVQSRTWYVDGIQRIPLAFQQLEVPIIAAVNGPAIGAGNDLACMCDIRVAARSARFAESFVKVGLIPGDGGAWLLPRVVGQSKAREMAFTGDLLDADQALACGLVSQVVDDDELLPAARRIAERIAANPPHAVRMTKRLMNEAQGQSLATVLQMSAAFQAVAHTTRDHAEAITAFTEKRAPVFTGD
ncbi:crotonase/enoyl-CoA hydratase family protein [Novosphingobium sp.]|uniref:crotonase/enoyl-CoA hydratase family protein n=1 Tax=Novosphingobium sp. TaxID=1874826 RepID=UPI0026115D84|nr:crotonase/enoyl-CoA hydratase family protein [Novosphingobium sp.]